MSKSEVQFFLKKGKIFNSHDNLLVTAKLHLSAACIEKQAEINQAEPCIF